MKTLYKALAVSALLTGFASTGAQAAVIAGWTFETSIPAYAGPFGPETGVGAASGFHAIASTYSSPAGNGSAHSFSSNTWAVGDYYQFRVSTAGYSSLALSWDQTSSNTGPRDFTLSYSLNGTTFTDLLDYSVLPNASPNPAWNATTASSLYSFNASPGAALDNQALVFFRLTDRSTTSANGGTVAVSGTDRVDNFIVAGAAISQVPLPAAVWLLGSGLLGLAGVGRQRRLV